MTGGKQSQLLAPTDLDWTVRLDWSLTKLKTNIDFVKQNGIVLEGTKTSTNLDILQGRGGLRSVSDENPKIKSTCS